MGVLEQSQFVKNSAIERTAFNQGDYAATNNALQGLTAGARKTVTYFNQATPAAINRTNTIDTSTTRSLTQTSYTQIENLELIFPTAQIDFDWDADLTEALVAGEALIYPGMQPLIGDQFLYPIGDGRLGQFQVSGVKPLSFRRRTFLQISFYLTQIASDASIQLLIDAAGDSVVTFDKKLALDGEQGGFLTKDSFKVLQQLRQMREVLGRYYFSSFFVNAVSSYVAPDGLYDPYVVRFVNTKIPFSLIACRPSQLNPDSDSVYPLTLWGRLADRMTMSLDGLYSHADKRQRTNGYMDVGITPLINRYYIAAGHPPPADQQLPAGYIGWYVFSQAFYDGDDLNMSDLEALVAESILTRRIADPQSLLVDHVNTYRSGTPMEQFYHIPLYLHLIDVALASYASAP